MRQRLTCLLLLLLAAAATLSAQGYGSTYYRVKFPDDVELTGCNATPPAKEWPTIERYDTCKINIGVSIQDQYYYTNGSRKCYKIVRRYRLVDWCAPYRPYRPYVVINPTNTTEGAMAYGTMYNYGYLEYEQIIKVRDDAAPRFVRCPQTPAVLCDYTANDPKKYNNGYRDQCEGPLTLTTAVTDGCSGANMSLRYFLYLDMDGDGTMERFVNSTNAFDTMARPLVTTMRNDTLYAAIQFPTWFEVPHGKHKVEWIANDDCGNVSACKYEFEVADCSAPSILCIHGLSMPIMQTGMAMVDIRAFQPRVWDNCTPIDQLEIGIKRALPYDIGFPKGQTALSFTCAERDTQRVQIWARDRAGNVGYCTTYILIQDPDSICRRIPIQGGANERSISPETTFASGLMPNPTYDGHIQLNCWLPQPDDLTLRVWSAAGQLLYEQRQTFDAGQQTWHIQLPTQLQHQGWVVVQASGKTGTTVHRLLMQGE